MTRAVQSMRTLPAPRCPSRRDRRSSLPRRQPDRWLRSCHEPGVSGVASRERHARRTRLDVRSHQLPAPAAAPAPAALSRITPHLDAQRSTSSSLSSGSTTLSAPSRLAADFARISSRSSTDVARTTTRNVRDRHAGMQLPVDDTGRLRACVWPDVSPIWRLRTMPRYAVSARRRRRRSAPEFAGPHPSERSGPEEFLADTVWRVLEPARASRRDVTHGADSRRHAPGSLIIRGRCRRMGVDSRNIGAALSCRRSR